MKKYTNLALLIAICLTTIVAVGCSKETTQTQQLYVDAKAMWDEINRAFSLQGNSQERITAMNKVITDKLDLQLVSKLEQYLKDAPSGKYAKEAQLLLDQARNSEQIIRLGQVRPFLEKAGAPKTAAEVDSVTKTISKARSDSAK
jgi:hypothetical protein